MSYIMLKGGIEYIAETEHQKEAYEKKGFEVYIPGTEPEAVAENATVEEATEPEAKKK